MKKIFTVVLLLVFVLAGCAKDVSYEVTEFETEVIRVEAVYHPNEVYANTANMYLTQKNYSMWSTYMTLANSSGHYNYHITINVDGNDYNIVRSEYYKVGDQIVVKKVITHSGPNIIKTEYQ